MIKLTKSLLWIGLITAFSGCGQNPTTPLKPKIDINLPVVDAKKIRTITDIDSIALEWSAINTSNISGYYIIRKDMQKDASYKRVKTLKNKYTSHYLDKNLDPNSKYAYKISLFNDTDFESQASDTVIVSTLPNLKSVSLIDSISDLPNQIKILWRPHSNLRVEKYLIQRTSSSQQKWKNIATVKDRLNVEYIDTELGNNDTYTYRIKSLTFDGIESNPSSITSATTKPLPDQISKLAASSNLAKKIQLSWGKSKTEDVVSYNIYRSSGVNGNFKNIGTGKLNHNRYDDEIGKDGEIYFYKITTVDKDNLESNINKINPVMGQTLNKPERPNITLAQIQGNKIILNWKSNDNRIVSFNIYKKEKNGWNSTKEKLIPNVIGDRFEDLDVVRGVEYNYSLQSVDKNGLVSIKTDEVSTMLPKLQIKKIKK